MAVIVTFGFTGARYQGTNLLMKGHQAIRNLMSVPNCELFLVGLHISRTCACNVIVITKYSKCVHARLLINSLSNSESPLYLEGRSLQSVEILAPVWDAVFTFDNQVVLRLFSIYSENYEHWMLYTPDGNVLSFGPGSHWSYESSEAVPA